MPDNISELCGRFIAVRDIIKENFIWDDSYIHPAAAMTFFTRGVLPDPDKMRECRKTLKKNTSLMSYFRGATELLIISEMSVSPDPEMYLEKIFKAYGALKENFSGSEYLPAAAMLLAGSETKISYSIIVEKAKKIFDIINRRHRILTSNEDVISCLTLAFSDMEAENAADEVEACYSLLSPDFWNNPAQALAFALALYDGSPETKCLKAMELYTKLAEKKHKWSEGIELAALGPAAMLSEDTETIAEQLIKIDDFLSEQKGYGILGIDKKTRMMHASMILTAGSDLTDGGAAITGTISVIIAIETAAMAAILGGTTASSAVNR